MVRCSLLFCLLFSVAYTVRSDPKRDTLAEFFAGALLLQSATGLSPEQKVKKYRELQALTGISGAKATGLLNGFRERPHEWKKLSARIQPLLSDTMTAAKKTDGSAAAESHIKR